MITETTKQMLESKCRALCNSFSLSSVCIVQKLGPRRHYLAGCGTPLLQRPEHLRLSDNLALIWHGDLSEEAQAALCKDLEEIVNRIERELADTDAAPSEMNDHVFLKRIF